MITLNSTEPLEGQEAEVDEDIRLFEEWFKKQGNDPLVRSEIAILKTYAYFKLRGQSQG